MKKTFILCLAMLCKYAVEAQSKPPIRIGIEAAHLFDLYEGETQLDNGYTDIDLRGINGTNTKIDLAVGVNLEIPVGLQSSLFISFTKGEMTSEKENQYAKSYINLLGFHYRKYFVNRKYINNRLNPNVFYARPFYQGGIGLNNFAGERYFTLDQGLFSITEGTCATTSVALGCVFEFGPRIQLLASTDFIVNFSDAIDGYDNEKKSDLMQKTGLSLLYRFAN